MNAPRNTMGRRLNARRQRGQSLIDFVIYTALAALALIGVVYFATSGRQGTNVSQETSNLTTMVSKAQALYSSSATGYLGVSTTILIQNGVVPKGMINGTNISSGFGTPVTVAPATLYTANDGLAWTYQVPPDSCSGFVASNQSTFAKVTVAGVAVKDTTAGTVLNPGTLGTQCASATGANLAVVMTATR